MNWLRLLLSTFTLSNAYTPNIFLHILFFVLIFVILMTINSMYEIAASIYFDKKRMQLHEEIVQCLRAEERDKFRSNRFKGAESAAQSASQSKIMTETGKPSTLATDTAVPSTTPPTKAEGSKKMSSAAKSKKDVKAKKKG